MKFVNHALLLRLFILLLSIILSVIFISTALGWPNRPAENTLMQAQVDLSAGTNDAAPHILVLKDQNGKICVYLGDDLLLRTDIPTASLPEQDRAALQKGIVVADEAEMHARLEDFGA